MHVDATARTVNRAHFSCKFESKSGAVALTLLACGGCGEDSSSAADAGPEELACDAEGPFDIAHFNLTREFDYLSIRSNQSFSPQIKNEVGVACSGAANKEKCLPDLDAVEISTPGGIGTYYSPCGGSSVDYSFVGTIGDEIVVPGPEDFTSLLGEVDTVGEAALCAFRKAYRQAGCRQLVPDAPPYEFVLPQTVNDCSSATFDPIRSFRLIVDSDCNVTQIGNEWYGAPCPTPLKLMGCP